MFLIFYFKQKTSYELRISDWSSDVCSSDLVASSASTSPKPKKEVAPSAATKAVAVASKPVQAAPIPRKDVAPRIMHEVVPDMFQPGKRPAARYAETQPPQGRRSEEHTSELQSLMRISYAVFCLKKKNT